MPGTSMRLGAGAAILSALVLFAPSSGAAQGKALRPLGGIDQMKAWFNANTAHVRAIFLLSPT
jgi:hypothetical protein